MRSPWSPLLQDEQAQLLQPALTEEVHLPSEHLRGLPLDPHQKVNISPQVGGPGLHTVFQMSSGGQNRGGQLLLSLFPLLFVHTPGTSGKKFNQKSEKEHCTESGLKTLSSLTPVTRISP